MTDAFPDQPTPPELVLVVDNGRPLAAADLGELFSTMARDYRQLTRGRTLVVIRLETGSLYAYLQDAFNQVAPYTKDALEIAKATKGIKEFARTLTEIFGRAKEHPDTLGQLKSWRHASARSIVAILKIAAESQSEIELREKTADSEITILKVTPIEAIRIREEARVHLASLPSPKALARLPAMKRPRGPCCPPQLCFNLLTMLTTLSASMVRSMRRAVPLRSPTYVPW